MPIFGLTSVVLGRQTLTKPTFLDVDFEH